MPLNLSLLLCSFNHKDLILMTEKLKGKVPLRLLKAKCKTCKPEIILKKSGREGAYDVGRVGGEVLKFGSFSESIRNLPSLIFLP